MSRRVSRSLVIVCVSLATLLLWRSLGRDAQPTVAETSRDSSSSLPSESSSSSSSESSWVAPAFDGLGESRTEHDAVTAAAERAATSAEIGVAAQLPVRIATQTAVIGEGRPIADVEFVVGVGWPGDPDARELLRATTDDQGVAHVLVPWSELEAARADPSPRLFVRVIGAGFKQHSSSCALPTRVDAVSLRVLAHPGGTLIGRLFDAAGRPCSGFVRGAAPGELGRGLRYSCKTDARGWFALHFDAPGTFDLAAHADDATLGTAGRRALDVAFGYPAERIELVLGGVGALRGRVVDGDGRPAAGVKLVAKLDELVEAEATERWLLAYGDLERDRVGRIVADRVTPVDGSFEFRGLCDGVFRVFVARDEFSLDGGVELTTEPIPSVPARDVELVYSHAYLAVRLVGPDGEPWSGRVRLSRQAPVSSNDEWPKEPQLIVTLPEDDLRGLDREEHGLAGRRTDDGTYVFECRANTSYRVGLLGGAQPWRPVDVFVPEGAGRVDVVVAVAPEAKFGVLDVTVREAVDPQRATGVEVVLEDPRNGSLVLRRFAPDRARHWRLELPGGEYRVVVQGAAELDLWHGTLWGARELGRFEQTIEVVAERETKVIASLGDGARLELSLVGKSDASDRAALQATGLTYLDGLEAAAKLAQVALLSPGHRPEPVDFRFGIDAGSAAGIHLRAGLPLGERQTSEVLPVGRYELVARLPGGREARAPVELLEGRTTSVELRFE
ncbi:MAG: hypothetical protein L6Q99_02815 [Planctomycetes bacterium]|nr:hypothetical protein [Planctomycetota bacterium]